MLNSKIKLSLDGEKSKKTRPKEGQKSQVLLEPVDEKKKLLAKSYETLDKKLKKLEEELKRREGKQQGLERELLDKQNELFHSKQKTQAAHGEVKEAQRRLYHSTKTIQVTDDDYSTIQAKLAQLSGKISSLPIQIKPYLKSTESVYASFYRKWPEESEPLGQLIGEKVDYTLISLLVEKWVMESIVRQIFEVKIHLNAQINLAFSNIERVFARRHADWIPDLRLKCSKATHDISKESPLVDEINQTKAAIVSRMVAELSDIYEENKEMQQRLEKIVDMASDLSLPMRGQEDPMIIKFLCREDKVISSQVKAQYRCIGKDQIILGISPVFLTKTVQDTTEENEDSGDSYIRNCTVVYSGKAIW
ncbi:hypothetical protein G6F56_007978 [Rhizopus delemar]|uniref:Uncharacterized protein n=1 Tax=Rhizopus stolonifer TaxID=4846 RepID=A0A367IVY9_RHIST|nr:hypothetical protein G6F56_007978 [Rhizopus delemar]RCH81860.1 hypothetical protein CU098_006899 [Rhizopus stolonifer]